MGNITAASAILALTITNAYPSGVTLGGYAPDEAWDFPEVEVTETQLGVDGILSAGLVPVAFDHHITLQADSPSGVVFDNWWTASKAAGYSLPATGTCIVPGPGLQYTLVQGYLIRYKPAAKVARVLQPRTFMLRWQTLVASPYAGL